MSGLLGVLKTEDLQGEYEYHLVDMLGRGGFGVVYKARAAFPAIKHRNETMRKGLRLSIDKKRKEEGYPSISDEAFDETIPPLERITEQQNGSVVFALKSLVEDAEHEKTGLDRFKREREYHAQIYHPNIITVLDYGSGKLEMPDVSTRKPFLAVEYIHDKMSTAEIYRSGLDNILEVILQVARGLECLQDFGVVHRDLKPDNILVSEKTRVAKISDLGLIRSREGRGYTQTGTGIGTPTYMSPEQMSNAKSVDIRTDIYALGATLYEYVTNRLPFDHIDNMMVMFGAKVEGNLMPISKISTRLPEVDEHLEALVYRLMSPDPEERHHTPKEVIEDIERYKSMRRVLDRTIEYKSGGLTVSREMMGSGKVSFRPQKLRTQKTAHTIEQKRKEQKRRRSTHLRTQKRKQKKGSGALAGGAFAAAIMAGGLILASYSSRRNNSQAPHRKTTHEQPSITQEITKIPEKTKNKPIKIPAQPKINENTHADINTGTSTDGNTPTINTHTLDTLAEQAISYDLSKTKDQNKFRQDWKISDKGSYEFTNEGLLINNAIIRFRKPVTENFEYMIEITPKTVKRVPLSVSFSSDLNIETFNVYPRAVLNFAGELGLVTFNGINTRNEASPYYSGAQVLKVINGEDYKIMMKKTGNRFMVDVNDNPVFLSKWPEAVNGKYFLRIGNGRNTPGETLIRKIELK